MNPCSPGHCSEGQWYALSIVCFSCSPANVRLPGFAFRTLRLCLQWVQLESSKPSSLQSNLESGALRLLLDVRELLSIYLPIYHYLSICREPKPFHLSNESHSETSADQASKPPRRPAGPQMPRPQKTQF